MSRILTAILALATWVQAARIPADDDKLINESHHVITGEVISVESKVQQSTSYDVIGLKDKVFFIKVKVHFVAKGEVIKPGEEVVVLAWRPHKSPVPRPPGPQGHQTIPKKGERVTCFLTTQRSMDKIEGTHEAYMPNGITTKKILLPDA